MPNWQDALQRYLAERKAGAAQTERSLERHS
jgi:hypothetical protein